MTETRGTSVTPLEKLEAAISDLTVGKWDHVHISSFDEIHVYMGQGQHWSVGQCSPINAAGICAMRNCIAELIAVVKAGRDLQLMLDDQYGIDKPELTHVRWTFANLERKIEEVTR